MTAPKELPISGMPRLAPWIVRRPRLEDWLGRFRGVPVRFLVAPPGFGKTMALASYMRNSSKNGIYCVVAQNATVPDVMDAIAVAIGVQSGIASHDDLLRALEAAAPLELGLDCEGVPQADVVAEIVRLIEDVADGVSLMVACRSRAAFDVRQFVASGTASLCDAERLAFTADEIRHLADTCGVPFTHADVLRMLEVSDGWPQIVSGALRKAAEDSCPLSEAFENWRMRHGHLFNEFIASTLARVAEGESNLVLRMMSGSHIDDREQLQMLEEHGLFVVHTADGYRPLRALSRSRVYDRYGRRAKNVKPMHVQLFGWFNAEIDRQPIEWIRRRDRQVFKYLALQPGGTVSRAEIGHVFWPDAEKHLVAQSLRTACSNIRKAIAQIVGFGNVDAYFRAGYELAIDLDNVIVDVNRFIAHADDADATFARGDVQAAHAHYRSAARLYHGSLLIGDAHEPWVGTLAAPLEQRHAIVTQRFTEIAAALEYESVGEPERRVASGE